MQNFPELFLVLIVLSNELYVKRIHNKQRSGQVRFISQHGHSGEGYKCYMMSKFSINKKGSTKNTSSFLPWVEIQSNSTWGKKKRCVKVISQNGFYFL